MCGSSPTTPRRDTRRRSLDRGREIAGNISGVAEAAATTTEGVTRTQEAAIELSRMSGQLQSVVARFRY